MASISARGSATAQELLYAAQALCARLARLRFSHPVAHVYNPLVYAWAPHAEYLRKFATGPKRVVFLGMNPGPFGMVQTGIPFGEVTAVKGWLRIRGSVNPPAGQHPKRPVEGFACARSEVSGQRLWGLFARRFGPSQRFFDRHMVVNYCPLAFLEATGRNRTPDKLPRSEQKALFAACDQHLIRILNALQPEWLIGIGDFAWKRAQAVASPEGPRCGRILHPSPASPAANRDWAGTATKQLIQLGIWS